MQRIENTDAAILIVEDNDDDFEAVVRAITMTCLPNSIIRCEDGNDIYAYIRGDDGYADRQTYPIPGIILLDINMSGLNGIDVVKEIRVHPSWHIVPVVMLTTSDDPQDISDSYSAGANGYIRKPVSVEQLYEAMSSWKEYWFETNLLPNTYIRSL